MAIYHMRVKVGSRANGQNAIASASYRAGEKLHCDAENRDFDYSRKQAVVHSEIMLPDGAPAEFADRATLWNAVEAAERQKNGQIFREFEVSLPNECSNEEKLQMARELAASFAAEGMCVDFSIHDVKAGQRKAQGATAAADNCHVHFMCTMRALKDGKFLPKRRTVYRLDKDGSKIPVIGKDGKQKIEKKTGRKVFERVDEKTVDWDDKEKVQEWRERWQNIANKYLPKEKQIDCRTLETQQAEMQEKLSTIERTIENAKNNIRRLNRSRTVRQTNRRKAAVQSWHRKLDMLNMSERDDIVRQDARERERLVEADRTADHDLLRPEREIHARHDRKDSNTAAHNILYPLSADERRKRVEQELTSDIEKLWAEYRRLAPAIEKEIRARVEKEIPMPEPPKLVDIEPLKKYNDKLEKEVSRQEQLVAELEEQKKDIATGWLGFKKYVYEIQSAEHLQAPEKLKAVKRELWDAQTELRQAESNNAHQQRLYEQAVHDRPQRVALLVQSRLQSHSLLKTLAAEVKFRENVLSILRDFPKLDRLTKAVPLAPPGKTRKQAIAARNAAAAPIIKAAAACHSCGGGKSLLQLLDRAIAGADKSPAYPAVVPEGRDAINEWLKQEGKTRDEKLMENDAKGYF